MYFLHFLMYLIIPWELSCSDSALILLFSVQLSVVRAENYQTVIWVEYVDMYYFTFSFWSDLVCTSSKFFTTTYCFSQTSKLLLSRLLYPQACSGRWVVRALVEFLKISLQVVWRSWDGLPFYNTESMSTSGVFSFSVNFNVLVLLHCVFLGGYGRRCGIGCHFPQNLELSIGVCVFLLIMHEI